MYKPKRRGQQAEKLARNYLQKYGYHIAAQNFYFGKHEIDIIARKPMVLIFVEVKSRSSTRFGFPESTVSASQVESIRMAAEEYMEQIGWNHAVRFDIISIEWQGNGHRLRHFKDAFY